MMTTKDTMSLIPAWGIKLFDIYHMIYNQRDPYMNEMDEKNTNTYIQKLTIHE